MNRLFKYRRSVDSMKHRYDRIHRFYGWVERSLGPKLDIIIREKIATIPDTSSDTAIEYACGSGLLTLKLSPLFKSITGRDISPGMLARAQRRAKKERHQIAFKEGNILAIDESANSYDYAFVSFALHLFSPEIEKQIIKSLCRVARKTVFIIDHDKQWRMGMAIVEWLEGSHYDQYLKIDFSTIAEEIGCHAFEQAQIQDCAVLSFMCDGIKPR